MGEEEGKEMAEVIKKGIKMTRLDISSTAINPLPLLPSLLSHPSLSHVDISRNGTCNFTDTGTLSFSFIFYSLIIYYFKL